MLPSVQSARPFLHRLPKVLVASLVIAATVAMPVEARQRHNDNNGVDESDIVKGVVASVLLGSVVNGMMQPRPVPQPQPLPRPVVVRPQPVRPPVYVPQPVYVPAPVSIYSTPAAHAFNSYSYYERQMIQRRLAMQGYYYGGIDASFGPGTYNAVVSYARAARLSAQLGSTAGAFGVYDSLLY